ncbi:ankyrin repeat-containing domain protein [Mycena amicta]|nr:ankyrin repeat-containing domain protein [Mycena amicta]
MASLSSSYLPPELILLIGEPLPPSSLNTLTQTCTGLHCILQPVLDALLTPELANEILLKAAGGGKPDIVKKLLAPPISTDPNAYPENTCTPLHAAADAGRTAIVQQLLDAGADVGRCWGIQEEVQPLHCAVLGQHIDSARLLIERGATVNKWYGSEWTSYPLCDAVIRGNADMVRLLLDHGADPEQRGEYGTALANAVRQRDIPIMKILLEAGADANAKLPLNPGWLCGGPPPPHRVTLLYFVLGLRHPKHEYSPEPFKLPEGGREEIMGLLMKYGALKIGAIATVREHMKGLADAEGMTERELRVKVDGIFAKVEASRRKSALWPKWLRTSYRALRSPK